MSRIKKIVQLFIDIFKTQYFGFVQGHSYLSKIQVKNIKYILNEGDSEEITKQYEKKFASIIGNGYGVSFASGRMGFYTLMQVLNIGKGDEVIMQGSTCSVMPNAVLRTGAKPVFADIDPDTFGSSPNAIKKNITSRTKMIVAQHSFGIPCKIDKIVEIGKKHNIFILEDSAITLDSSLDGIKVGNWGDAALFSTDHSKPLNSLIGGFIYTKNKEIYKKLVKYNEQLPQLDKDHQKRLFKQFLYERKYYSPRKYALGIGLMSIKNKFYKLHSKKSEYTFLTADYTKSTKNKNVTYPYPAKLPAFLAQLGIYEIDRWDSEKAERKKLLRDYITLSEKLGFKEYLPAAYFNPRLKIVPLRFVFTYPDVIDIRRKMSRFIDINWFWFQKPIICCDDPEEFDYKWGSCNISETIGEKIINWPCVLTHKYDQRLLEKFQDVFNA